MPLHPCVSLESFLNYSRPELASRICTTEGIWREPSDVPDSVRQEFNDPDDFVEDYLTPIDFGKEWLFDLTCKYQPRTGAMIMNGSPLFVRAERFHNGGLSGVMAVEINGRIVRFFRGFCGDNPSDDGYAVLNDKPTGYEKSLPDGLGEAYYTRFLGMSLLPESTISIYSWALPKEASMWRSIDFYLDDYGKEKTRQLMSEQLLSKAI